MLFQNIVNRIHLKNRKELSRCRILIAIPEKASFTSPGSLTVEASLVLPIFLMVITGLLCFFQIMLFQIRLQQAMDLAVQKASAYYYAAEAAAQSRGGDSESSGQNLERADSVEKELLIRGITTATLKAMILAGLDEQAFAQVSIEGGAAGLSLLQSQLPDAEGALDLVVSYRVKVPFLPGQAGKMSFTQRSRQMIWSGSVRWKEGADENAGEEEMVYVTEYGTVYHRDMNCSYLKLSIQSVLPGEVGKKRNRYGEKYTACELCTEGVIPFYVYITESGNRYHYLLRCSGLTRNIRKIPLSQAEGLGECSRCKKAG